MANQDLQIIKLTHASRAAFASDTSGVTDPIMSIITTDPREIGIKVSGVYSYFGVYEEAIAALEASVSSNTASISTLQASIGPIESAFSGCVTAPYGKVIPNNHDIEVYNPLLFVRLVDAGQLAASHITGLYLASSIMQGLPPSGFLVTIAANEVDVGVTVYNDGDKAFGTVAVDTPGIVVMIDPSDINKVVGFFVTDYAGLNLTDVGFALADVIGTPFGLNPEVIGYTAAGPVDVNRGMEWNIEVIHKAEWSVSATLDYKLTLGGLTLLDESYPIIEDTGGAKSLATKFKIQFLGMDFLGGESFEYRFRIFTEWAFSSGTEIVPDSFPLPVETSLSISSISGAGWGEQAWFGLEVLLDGDGGTRTLDLLSSTMKFTSPE